MSVDTIAALADAKARLDMARLLLASFQRFRDDVGVATIALCDGQTREQVAALLLDALRDIEARESEFYLGEGAV